MSKELVFLYICCVSSISNNLFILCGIYKYLVEVKRCWLQKLKFSYKFICFEVKIAFTICIWLLKSKLYIVICD